MTTRAQRNAFAPWVVLCTLAFAAPLPADTVHMKSGDVVEGSLARASFLIDTPRGRLDVPTDSVARMVVQGTEVRLHLIDGTTLEGALQDSTLRLETDLFSRHLELSEIESLTISASEITVPAGTSVPLVLATRLGSRGAEVGEDVALCATEPVLVDGKTVVEG